MAYNKRLQALIDLALPLGLDIATHNPGDGVTRYRFFPNTGNKPRYFGGHEVYTALSPREAEAFLRGYRYGYEAGKKEERL